MQQKNFDLHHGKDIFAYPFAGQEVLNMFQEYICFKKSREEVTERPQQMLAKWAANELEMRENGPHTNSTKSRYPLF